ncbi:MAG TPA: response regulator [Bosea sp. (in: a-proteobacteria)]|jgi:CheY-like chemotaxis protein|uniref:response regulator n=1 Tax=Bosea sp. (in: a-proteobacteria) TaxID=1871050 RepID=UPI002E0DD225|nr:response regulator [Bosea sp. (in: a-proteobacteria)]
MWFKRLYSFSSILDLRDYAKGKRYSKIKNDIRSSVKIAIIDDQKFLARPNLSTYGYNIVELPDIRSVTEIKDFDIILCDLMGVGKSFDQAIGGASIIKEIKQNYPTKIVIAYTAARANTSEASVAKEFADDFLKKDTEISKWVERLDDAIEVASDPYRRWLVARQGLLDEEVDIRRLVELESAYVKSVLDSDKSFSKLTEAMAAMNLGTHASGIIQGLVSSAIYSLIFSK